MEQRVAVARPAKKSEAVGYFPPKRVRKSPREIKSTASSSMKSSKNFHTVLNEASTHPKP